MVLQYKPKKCKDFFVYIHLNYNSILYRYAHFILLRHRTNTNRAMNLSFIEKYKSILTKR
jgi:hypothetical protein